MKIKQLSAQEAQKIAAGEVVERPANVVKELLENALDAGATAITIYIQEGGKKLIKVVDNGCGMSAQDAHMCIKHHATSKITSVTDLEHISTFGFRGEALSSIAAVSKLIITTKEETTLAGITLEIDQGIVQAEHIAACNTGTSITVHDLFYAVPARRKFLKSRDAEWRMILQLFFAVCLDYPQVYFKLYSEDTLIYNCPQTTDLIVRIEQLYEHALAQQVLLAQAHEPRMNTQVTLAFSDPNYTRYDRSQIFVFVNKRWVKNHKLVQAFIKGYQNMLPTGKFPAGFLFITLDSHYVDSNIHPRKEEVQFMHPKIIESLIESTVKKRLEEYTNTNLGAPGSLSILPINQSLSKYSQEFSPESTQIITHNTYAQQQSNYQYQNLESMQENTAEYALSHLVRVAKALTTSPSPTLEHTLEQETTPKSPLDTIQELHKSVPLIQTTLNTEHLSAQHISAQIPVQPALTYTLLGQALRTYIIIELPEGLTLIDQHAAHERILYEKFRTQFNNPESLVRVLPEIITLNKTDITTLADYLPLCAQYGLIITVLSDTQLAVQETPLYLKNQSLKDIVQQLISWITDTESLEQTAVQKLLQEKLHAQLSCKAAVKAGDILTSTSMHQIIHDLYSLETKLTCPHGRPTCWTLTQQELEKKFKRTYK